MPPMLTLAVLSVIWLSNTLRLLYATIAPPYSALQSVMAQFCTERLVPRSCRIPRSFSMLISWLSVVRFVIRINETCCLNQFNDCELFVVLFSCPCMCEHLCQRAFTLRTQHVHDCDWQCNYLVTEDDATNAFIAAAVRRTTFNSLEICETSCSF